jgi:hypothetical protein
VGARSSLPVCKPEPDLSYGPAGQDDKPAANSLHPVHVTFNSA